jgi:hypothetical protein
MSDKVLSDMTIKILSFQPRDTISKVFVRISFHDPDGPPHNSATLDLFVDQTDSFEEIRKRAIQAARSFFEKSLSADPVETKE